MAIIHIIEKDCGIKEIFFLNEPLGFVYVMYLLEPQFLHLWNNFNVYIPDLWGLKIFDSPENLRPLNSSVSIVLCDIFQML